MRNLHTNEERPWLCRTIEVARVAELSLVEVTLEAVEDILHTAIHLQVYVVVQDECIAGLEVEIEEVGRRLHAVILDVTRIVRHNH